MNRFNPIRLCALMGCCFALGAAQAAPMANDDVSAQKSKISADYKAAKEHCKTLSGNAKDVCNEEAKGNEKIAKAELDVRQNDNARNQEKLAKTRADAAYEVAKEKCDDLSGSQKSACRTEAKAAHKRAVADAKATHDMSTARNDATSRTGTGATGATGATSTGTSAGMAPPAGSTMRHDNCDALTGDAKANCLSAAKARGTKG